MNGKYFLDTNFLVYCFSEDEPEKQAACLRILQEGQGKIHFVLSTQVLAEFAVVMIGKFKQPPAKIKSIIEDLELFEVVQVDASLIKEAIDIQTIHQLSFWDSTILAAAKNAHCHTVLTEDMHHGARLAGLILQNPFLS
ncbi:MAG TPA: PIN domain-containing protein [Saprospiraceae bacterium]|nr:PIN domain-containing protein [Saprospiraceae bacterium]HMP24849.1 PIN domain-containing protein [Saprospiraceae bacterium]